MRKRTRLLGVLMALGLWLVAPVQAANQPSFNVPADVLAKLSPAPAGFEWRMHKNALLVKPAPWKEVARPEPEQRFPITTYLTSPSGDAEGNFGEPRLTLSIISGFKKTIGSTAAEMADFYLNPILGVLQAGPREDVMIYNQGVAGDFVNTVLRYRETPADKSPVIVHTFVLANNTAESVHVFAFEAPEAEWDQAWASTGEPLLRRVRVLSSLPAH